METPTKIKPFAEKDRKYFREIATTIINIL